jgi:uncharacterized membrane protein
MDFQLTLIAFVLPALAVALGLPMALGLAPPNRFYGYRTGKTLSSTVVWYRANSVSGSSLIIAGMAAIGHNALFQHDHANLPSATQQLLMTRSTGLLLVLALVISASYVRKLSPNE